MSKQKTQIRKPLYFHPRKDGDYSGFVFSETWQQTEFLQFGSHFRGKYAGVRRGAGLRWRPQNAKHFEALTEPDIREEFTTTPPLQPLLAPYAALLPDACPRCQRKAPSICPSGIPLRRSASVPAPSAPRHWNLATLFLRASRPRNC